MQILRWFTIPIDVLRVHRATDDSSQNNWVEKSNGWIGDALVDGASLHWEYHECYHGLTEEDLRVMSKNELEKFEDERTMNNAWRVAEEVRIRIDGEPAPKGFLSAVVSEYLL